MYKELKRRSIARLIELILKNNKEQTTLSFVMIESYIDAVRSIFDQASIDVFRDIPLSAPIRPIIYTKVRLYYSEGCHYFTMNGK